MKARRQLKILEIVKNHRIRTQEDLAEKLHQEGLHVTQATVSRDIKELGLVKTPTGDGMYFYTVAEEPSLPNDRMMRLFRDCVLSVEVSENLVVLTTLPATAEAVCEAIDGLKWSEVIGSLAGERNVVLIAKARSLGEELANRIRRLTA